MSGPSTSVVTKKINSNTMVVSDITTDTFTVTSTNWLLIILTTSKGKYDVGVSQATIEFAQHGTSTPTFHLYECNSGYSIVSNEIPLTKSGTLLISYYSGDVTSLVGDNYDGTHFFLLKCDSSATIYTHNSVSILRPKMTATTTSIESEAYWHLKNSKNINETIGNVDFGLDLYSGKYNLSIPIAHFSDSVLDLDICLCYDANLSDVSSYSSGTLSTGFPRGWKLNLQQFLYQVSDRFVYVDKDNKKHIFKLIEGSVNTYFDTCGTYLTLKQVSGNYNIYFPNGDYYVFSSGKLASINLYRGGTYITITINYNVNTGKLTSISYSGITNLLSIDYTSNSVLLYPFSESGSTNVITLNIDSSNRLSSIINLDSSNYVFSYLSSSYNYVMNSLSFGDKSLSVSFTNSKVNAIVIEDNNTCLGAYSINYAINFTTYSFSPFNNSSLTTYTLCEFDNNKNLVEESLIADGHIEAAKKYYFDTRFNYTLDICGSKAPSTITIGGTVRNLETTPESIDNLTIYYQINAQSYLTYFSFLYFEVSSLASVSTSISYYLYFVDSSNNETLLYSGLKTVDFSNSSSYPFFFPIFSRGITPSEKLKLVINRTGSDTVSISRLRLYNFNSTINYIKTELTNFSYLTHYVVDKSANPLQFSSSYQQSISINGQTRSLIIEQEDSLNIFTYALLDKYYLFYKNGEECILLTSDQFTNAHLRYMSLSNYHYTFDGRFLNFFSDIKFTSLNVSSIYLSDTHYLTNEKIRCDFDNDNPDDKIKKTRINNYFNVVDEIDEFGKTTTNTYTSLGRLEYSTKTFGSKSLKSSVYSHANNRTIYAETLSSGNLVISTTYNYDARFRLSSETLSNHNAVLYSYDVRDNLVSVSQSNKNNSITTTDGKIDSVSSNSSNSFTFTYEPTTKYTYWNGNTFIETTTDGTGYYTKSININGDNITYKYDKFNRLVSETHSVNYRVINYLYSDISSGSKLLEIYVTNENNVTIFDCIYTYDNYGRLVTSNYNQYPRKVVFYNPPKDNDDVDKTYRTRNEYVNNFGGQSEYISTRFDKVYGTFYKTTFSDSSNVVTHLSLLDPTYASNLNYEGIYFDGTVKFANFLTPLTYNNQESPLISESEFILHTGSVPVSKITSYTYNTDGNISSITYPCFSTGITYTYNAYDELVSENNPYFGSISYSYDVQGNLTSIVRNNITTSMSYDSYNKITSASVGGNTYTFSYNSYGYPTTYKGNTMSYSGNNVLRYGNTYFTYDVLGRRTSKYIDNNNKTDYYFVDDHLFMEKKCISGTWHQCNFIYGSTGVIGIKVDGLFYFYLKDILGNVVALYGLDGAICAKYIYDAYGNHVVLDNSNNVITSLSHPGNLNPFRYRGYYYDTETGLYNLGYRFYDPELGRFVTPDTFAYLEPNKINGTNLYSYCYGNPIRYVDKDGHVSVTLLLVGFAIGAALGAGASIVSQGLTNGWDNINGWQVMWDSAIGGIGGMISFGTFGIIGSTIASAGLGFVGSVGGDLIANNGNWNQVNWYKALVMGAVNGFAGYLSGPGLQNGKAIGEAIGSALSETASYKAIITAAKRYGTGIGFQRTWNLYGNQVIFNALFVTPTIITKGKMIATLVMSASSIATVSFNWLNKYFNFWN